jgi:hypothetical protein
MPKVRFELLFNLFFKHSVMTDKHIVIHDEIDKTKTCKQQEYKLDFRKKALDSRSPKEPFVYSIHTSFKLHLFN